MKPIYALLGVDMETDVGSFTPFYEGTKHGTPLLLDLFREKGVRGTFFFTGDCAAENPGRCAESGGKRQRSRLPFFVPRDGRR